MVVGGGKSRARFSEDPGVVTHEPIPGFSKNELSIQLFNIIRKEMTNQEESCESFQEMYSGNLASYLWQGLVVGR